ncbi:MAG: hypothetical protein ABH950_08335 [Candidatus Altiarchaeota archaeon]
MSRIDFLSDIKPTKKNIVLATTIFIFLVPCIAYDTGIRCVKAPCPTAGGVATIAWILIHRNELYYWELFYPYTIAGAIISYLGASLIIKLCKRNLTEKKSEKNSKKEN